MTVELRYAVAADIPAIVADARDADVVEFAALGVTVEQAMVTGMEVSDWTAVALIDGVPLGMFGVAAVNVVAGIGAPWLVATNALVRHGKEALPVCRPALEAMLGCYPRLVNVVHDKNVVAKKWLKWLGFEFSEGVIGIGGEAFRSFRKGEF